MSGARQRAFIQVDVAGRLVVWAVCLSFCSCGYYHYAGPLKPLDEQGVALAVADDGSVTFTQDRFEVRLRYVTDRELNRQFAAHSTAGPKSTNPFTYGNTEFEAAEQGSRFTVFHLAVKNYTYPKVRIAPSRIELRAANRREYWTLGLQQLDTYFRAYALGYRGNEYARYQQRLDLLRRTLFKNEEVFSGQEKDGFLVFPALHPDVRKIEVVVHDAVLRFDFRNEPVETRSIAYKFERDTGRVYRDGVRPDIASR